jgi:hypothetical protein
MRDFVGEDARFDSSSTSRFEVGHGLEILFLDAILE